MKAFYITSSHRAVLGDPPIVKAGKSGGRSGQDRAEAFDEMAARFSTWKLPQVSPMAVGAVVLVALLVGAGYWLFSRQTLETRSEIAANALIKGEMKTVIDLCVPGTETEAIMWYGQVARKYNFLKLALAGEDPEVTLRVQGDTRGDSALVIATYAKKGTRIASSAFLESLQPVPSLANSNTTFELPLFWVKDTWGNWVLDGKRTAVGSIPSG
jgi:hypothetical protein